MKIFSLLEKKIIDWLKILFKLKRYEVPLKLDKLDLAALSTSGKITTYHISFFYNDYSLVEDWLKNNNIDGYYYSQPANLFKETNSRLTREDVYNSYRNANPRMIFRQKKDAMLFKLTWS